ncbi:MAG TPA: hypothetical protein VIA98_01900 [Allosphingosinicella sp.]|jgi:hypothetical protein
MTRFFLLPLLALGLSGCVAKTALDIATLPVKAASAAVDAATVSQAEADQKRGRQIREYEECLGREDRRAEKKKRESDYGRCEEPRPITR